MTNEKEPSTEIKSKKNISQHIIVEQIKFH